MPPKQLEPQVVYKPAENVDQAALDAAFDFIFEKIFEELEDSTE